MAVGDAHGQLLWVCGRPAVLNRAEQINFVEGAVWDEGHAGTNAPAPRCGSTVRCRSSPPSTSCVPSSLGPVPPRRSTTRSSQAILGIVDVTGSEAVASPQTLAMVRAAARMAEAELGRLVALSRPEDLWRPAPAVSVEALGRPDCQLTLSGRQLRLSPRHSEILVILVDHPDGLTGDQLAIELYPDEVSTSTMRAELTRLRSLLGGDLLDSRPYRLRKGLSCDWLHRHSSHRGRPSRRCHAGLPWAAAAALRRAGRRRAPRTPRTSAARGRARCRRGRPDGGLDAVAVGRRRPGHVAPPGPAGARGQPLHAIAAIELQRLDRELGWPDPPTHRGGAPHVATRQ